MKVVKLIAALVIGIAATACMAQKAATSGPAVTSKPAASAPASKPASKPASAPARVGS